MSLTEETKMRLLAEAVSKILPEYSFGLVLFRKESEGQVNYISNVMNQGMVDRFEELLKVLKKKQNFSTPSQN